MSNQRRSHDEQVDSDVSAAYRELAQEIPPTHLDHVVLNEAREAAKSGPARNVSWLRPAAWVTTIGLCLAIVLEVTDLVPQNEHPADQSIATGKKETGQSIATGKKDTGSGAPVAAQERPASRASREVPSPARDEISAVPAGMRAPAAAGVEAEAVEPGAGSEALESEMTAPVEVRSLDPTEMMMLRDAEERARAQEGDVREPIGALSKSMRPADSDSERYCGAHETETPQAWIECIMRLQQDGRHEEARLEHDRLHETFPGAEIPPLTAPLPDSP